MGLLRKKGPAVSATIGHKVLELEKGVGAEKEDFDTLDALVSGFARKYRPSKKAKEHFLKNINTYLQSKHLNYGYANDFLFDGLRNRNLCCYQLSILYLSMAEAADVELEGIITHNHMHVGWREAGELVEWEPTAGTLRKECERLPRLDVFKDTVSDDELLGVASRNIGLALTQGNDEKKAFRYLDLAIELLPHSTTYCAKGIASMKKGTLDDAFDSINHALGMNPDNIVALLALGVCQNTQGDYSKALTTYFDALKRIEHIQADHPRDTHLFHDTYASIGNGYIRLGDPRSAIEYLDEALRLDPSSARTYYQKGRCYELLGDSSRARDAFLRALDLAPKDRDIREKLSGLIQNP